MKILLIGNLPEDRQESMLRFQTMMQRGLLERGHQVICSSPRLRLAKIAGKYSYSGLSKYLGYWDKFVLYPRELGELARSQRPDVIHIIDHANACYAQSSPQASLVTCHDLQQIRASFGEIKQQQVGVLGRQFQRRILKDIKRAARIACVSRTTAHDLFRVAQIPASRITVIPNALNDPFSVIARETAHTRVESFLKSRDRGEVKIPSSFILNVGGDQWYKNRAGLLRIQARLHSSLPETPSLIMVGKPLSAQDKALAEQLGVSKYLIHLEQVPNEVLNALYCLAEGLLFPSFEEGFGWPLAEAQACACPIFTSDRAPMNEVAGPHSILFNPEDPESAANAIMSHWHQRHTLALQGLKLAARWRPATMLAAYEMLYTEISAEV